MTAASSNSTSIESITGIARAVAAQHGDCNKINKKEATVNHDDGEHSRKQQQQWHHQHDCGAASSNSKNRAAVHQHKFVASVQL